MTAGQLKLPWDKINFTDRPWAERPETIQEVGSIYTIQGFDLNYAGVILGPSIKYDEKKTKSMLTVVFTKITKLLKIEMIFLC